MMQKFLFTLVLLINIFFLSAQTTSWRGTTSTSWNTASNWTNGVPTATVSAIIGDENFIGSYQPNAKAANCFNLTIGGTKASTLTYSHPFTVNGTLTIQTNGTMTHTSNKNLTIKGNFICNGTFNPSRGGLIFAGTNQSFSGTSSSSFNLITVNSGATLNLLRNVVLSNRLTVSGVINPSDAGTYKVTAGSITVNNGGVLKVTGSTFASNYSVNPSISAGGIVDYCATSINQTISNSMTYSTLRISGGGIKTLQGNLPSLLASSSTSGVLEILSGTLDMATYTANRGTNRAGGRFVLSNGATLKTAGSGECFPSNFSMVSIDTGSNVIYYGGAQTIAAHTYGNLILTSNSGVATKTMPSVAFTVNGNFTSDLSGGGSAVNYTANANINIGSR